MFHGIRLLYEIQNSVSVITFYWNASTLSYYILSVAAFELQQQSWVVAIETIWPTMAKIVLSGPLKKKLAEARTSSHSMGGLKHKEKTSWDHSQPAAEMRTLWELFSLRYCTEADKQVSQCILTMTAWSSNMLYLCSFSRTGLAEVPVWAAATVTCRGQHWRGLTPECNLYRETIKTESIDILSCPKRRKRNKRPELFFFFCFFFLFK